jgi:putative membrane protein
MMRAFRAMPNPISEHQKAAELLAAERTFLAWIRTSLALISLGFVVAKFGVWLGEMARQLHTKATPHGTDGSVFLGMAMMGFGALLAIMAAWHCGVVRKAIERGEIVTNTALVISVTIGVVSLAGMMASVMFFTSAEP